MVRKKVKLRKVKATDEPTYDPTEGGRLCGTPRKSRPGRYCRRQSGFKTDHPGQGKCHLHGGRNQGASGQNGATGYAKQLFVHPYNAIIHDRMADKWNALAQSEYNVLDLVPEAHLLRVIIVDFINRYEEHTSALIRWHRGDTNTKPRRVMDIADASRLIDSLSKVVERIHKMRQEGAISLETFRRVTEAMAIVVAKYVKDPDTLGDIERDWNMIAIDAKRPEPVPEEITEEPTSDEEWEE